MFCCRQQYYWLLSWLSVIFMSLFYRSCYRTTKNIYIIVTSKPKDIHFTVRGFHGLPLCSDVCCQLTLKKRKHGNYDVYFTFYLLSLMSYGKGFLSQYLIQCNDSWNCPPRGSFSADIYCNSEWWNKKQYINNIKVLTKIIINIINLENTYQLLNLLLG